MLTTNHKRSHTENFWIQINIIKLSLSLSKLLTYVHNEITLVPWIFFNESFCKCGAKIFSLFIISAPKPPQSPNHFWNFKKVSHICKLTAQLASICAIPYIRSLPNPKLVSFYKGTMTNATLFASALQRTNHLPPINNAKWHHILDRITYIFFKSCIRKYNICCI